MDQNSNQNIEAALNSIARILDKAVVTFPSDQEKDWTPVFTNLSGGTLNYAKYTVVGNLVFYRLKYTLGSAGVAGSIQHSLPLEADPSTSVGSQSSPFGRSFYVDTGTNAYGGSAQFVNYTTVRLLVSIVSGTYETPVALLSNTVPHTWANTDIIESCGYYVKKP